MEQKSVHSYFQIINEPGRTCLKIVRGEEAIMVTDIADYLKKHNIPFSMKELSRAIFIARKDTTIELCKQRSLPIREEMHLFVTDNKTQAVGKFFPPSNDGTKLGRKDIVAQLRDRGIVYGIQQDVIDEFLNTRPYCTNMVFAKGKDARQGTNAWIEYFFNTNLKARPTLEEDGSVNFFKLNIINHVKVGDLLARLHPEDKGEEGQDVYGNPIKPKAVKRELLKYGRNIELSEDKKELYSQVNGHVNLVDGKVFVSNLMVVENADLSTGDIDYDGNLQVNGNVCSNIRINVRGNVEIRGVVEGATIHADGNITIARGINGMHKGNITAGGNIIAKFIENASVEAYGYVETESILHSRVLAGTEIRVGGKKGFITGGYVCATNLVEVKTLGSELGANTIVEIGINPETKRRYQYLENLLEEGTRFIDARQPIINAAMKKVMSGCKMDAKHVKHIQELSTEITLKKKEMETERKELEELLELMNVGSEAQIVVRDKAYPGTKIVISDVSKMIKTPVHYSRFVKMQGDVTVIGMN